MIRGRCPICAKSFEGASLDDLPGSPFCSERCRLIDLGRWIDQAYTVPADEKPRDENDERADEDAE